MRTSVSPARVLLPPPTAWTNAVVATFVVLSAVAWVGAVGLPVSAGLASGASVDVSTGRT